MKDHTLITISRQYGSGGREVAELLAKRMQVRCYDRQILYLAAEKMDAGEMDISAILDMSYKMPERTFMDSVTSLGYETIPPYNKMYREQAKVIRNIAEKESAVFLGRCADVVLKDFPECYNFFIYADEEYRKNRAKELYGNKTFKELEKENRTRERYYNYYTGQKWGDPQNYHLMINTSQIGPEKAVDLIINYVENCRK
ncbi:cytidylate kinase-like family protein [Clostridium sp. AF19-22AC]|jgi:cytidylate kinase|uniref:cytidylate kinase-like family protein n=1 Tax=Clostridia TaxID=186801 RepID=UPI000E49193A|nr:MULTISPECIES: cytidylate kinase-like family protein [Clostridia]RHR26641.1 cytidylate kinase-like family protein [Clostridium sp. AF19-22AC]